MIEIKSQKPVAIVGTRTFFDMRYVRKIMWTIATNRYVTGCARGVDACCRELCEDTREYKLPTVYKAKWKKANGEKDYKAGFKRNTRIINHKDLSLVVAFWDHNSNGTRDSINKAKNKGIPVFVVYYNDPLNGMEEYINKLKEYLKDINFHKEK